MKDQNKTKKQSPKELTRLPPRTTKPKLRKKKGKVLEEAIPCNESRYESLFDRIPVGLYRTRPTGQILDANPALVQMLGYSDREALLAINAADTYLNPETRIQRQTLMERDGLVRNFETQLRHADGSIVWAEENSRVLCDADGRVLCYEGSFQDITERKRMEEALQESEERYRTLFERSRDAIFITTREGEILDANQSMLDLLGYSKEEMIGLNARETYVHSKDRVKFQQEIERVGFVRDHEIRLRKKDGTAIECLFSSIVRRDADGNIVGYQGIIHNITKRKQTEEALRESEEKYRKIFENVQDVFYQANNEGNIIDISPSIERYSGFTREELIGKPIEQVYLNPEDRRGLLKAIREKGEVVDYEVLLKSKDNRLIYTSVNAHILFDPTGKPIGVEGTLRDVTEQKKAREELRKSEERFKDLYDNAPVGYHEYDTEGRITRVNRTDLEMLGYTREEMIGKPVWEFNVEKEVARKQILEKLAGSRPPGRGLERTYKRKDGTTIPVLIEDRLIVDENGQITGIRCTIQDITQRKQAEEALARQNREFEVLNETKDRFLGIAAHDLRNPLTTVKVSTQILKKHTSAPPDLAILDNIDKATQKMLNLINSLLDVSKIKSGKLEINPEDVDVAGFLKECHYANEIIGRQKGIALVLSVSEDIGHARFDKERMHQAVDNLLSNAFKYSNPNTTVTLGGKRSERGLEIWVEDQGVGIKDEDLPLLFEEFSKASAQPTAGESSHGLGLAIVRRVVELQGGKIEAKSNPAGGAIFTITLP